MSPDSGVSSPWLLPLIVGVWLVVFPLFWLGITGLLSIVGGWRDLARSYATDPATFSGIRPTNATGSLRRALLPVNYSNTLLVYVRSDGLGLATWRIFRFKHPPLFIPWTAVRDCQAGSLFFWRYADIRLHGSSVAIMVGGRAGRAILERWTSVRVADPGVPAVMYGR